MPSTPTTHPISISIFDIPLILDLICDNLTKEDLLPCLQVSRDWHGLFKPQALHVRFADLKKHQTWAILDHAAGIRSLAIDISDAGWFLNNPPSPCINLRTLRCVDFGYVEPGDYNSNNDDNDVPWDWSGDLYLSERQVDPSTNALNMIQSNPKLTALVVTHGRQHYHANHFTPAVLLSIAELQSLSLLKIELDIILPESFLVALLQHLPQSLEVLLVSVKGVHRFPGTSTTAPPIPQKHLNLRQITLYCCGYREEEDETNVVTTVNGAIVSLIRRSPRLVALKMSKYYGNAIVLLQTVADHCPGAETIDFDQCYHGTPNIATLTGSLLHLREFRFTGFYTAINDVERQQLSNFLCRSSLTLEVISIESDYRDYVYAIDPFRTAAWNFWPECPRLREYTFLLLPDFAPDHHNIDALVELLSGPTVTCWNLQKLELCITDYSGGGNVEEHRRYDSYEHQHNLFRSIYSFHRCLQSFNRLCQENIRIKWEICSSVREMTLDEVLPRINNRSQPPVTALNTRSSRVFDGDNGNKRETETEEEEGVEVGVTSLQPKEPEEISRQDLRLLNLYWSWRSGEENQQRAEANTKEDMLRCAESDTQDKNAGTAWARTHRRVGCHWRDWWSLAAELHGCNTVDMRYFGRLKECVHGNNHVYCSEDVSYPEDRFLSGYDVKVERGHRRRSMLRCRRKHIR